MQKNEKNNRKAMYVRYFIVSILVLGALPLYWPRFDLVVMAWVFAVLFFINDQLDEQLVDQPQVVSQINQPEVDDAFYYKQPLDSEKNNSSFFVSMTMWLFFINLPRKTELWDLFDLAVSSLFLALMLFRYFYLKYFDAVKNDTLTKNARKKSRHFLYFDAEVLKEIKGRKEWTIQLNQITSIDLGEGGAWIFYREGGQIKQHHLMFMQCERLPELQQKFRVIEQRLAQSVSNA